MTIVTDVCVPVNGAATPRGSDHGRAVACLTCFTSYATLLRRPGQRCGDLSHGQRQPCRGRVIPWPPRHDRRTLHQLAAARICFVCLEAIPVQQDLYRADLGILIHQDACAKTVAAEQRSYHRSARGRWRPRREVLARVAARRDRAA